MSWWDSTKMFFGRLARRQSCKVAPSPEVRLNPPDQDRAVILEWEKDMKAQSKRRIRGLRQKKDFKSKKGEIQNKNEGKHRTSNLVDEKIVTLGEKEVHNNIKAGDEDESNDIKVYQTQKLGTDVEQKNEKFVKINEEIDTISEVSSKHSGKKTSYQGQESLIEEPPKCVSIEDYNETRKSEKSDSDRELSQAKSDDEKSQSGQEHEQPIVATNHSQVPNKTTISEDFWDDVAEEFLYGEEEGGGEFSFFAGDEEEECKSTDGDLPEEEDVWRTAGWIDIWVKNTLLWRSAKYSDSDSEYQPEDGTIERNDSGLNDPTVIVNSFHVTDVNQLKISRMDTPDEWNEIEKQDLLSRTSTLISHLAEPNRLYSNVAKTEDWTEYFGSDNEDLAEEESVDCQNNMEIKAKTSSQIDLTTEVLLIKSRQSVMESRDSGLESEVSGKKSLTVSNPELCNLITQDVNPISRNLNLVHEVSSEPNTSDLPQVSPNAQGKLAMAILSTDNLDLSLIPGSENFAATTPTKVEEKAGHFGIVRRCIRWVSRKFNLKKARVAPAEMIGNEFPSAPYRPTKVKTEKSSRLCQLGKVKIETTSGSSKQKKLKRQKSSSPCQHVVTAKSSGACKQKRVANSPLPPASNHPGKVKTQKPSCNDTANRSQVISSPYRRERALRQQTTSSCDSLCGEVTLRRRKAKAGSQEWIRFPEGK